MIKMKDHPGYGMTVEFCQEQAYGKRKAKRDSFERCDTDGFVSQWASGIGAAQWELKAAVVRDGGYAPFQVLVDSDGVVVSCRNFTNDYGTAWLVRDEHQARIGRTFIPADGSHREGSRRRSRIQKNLGLRQELRDARAWVCIAGGGGRGLSGAASCYADTFPLRDDNKRLQFREDDER